MRNWSRPFLWTSSDFYQVGVKRDWRWDWRLYRGGHRGCNDRALSRLPSLFWEVESIVHQFWVFLFGADRDMCWFGNNLVLPIISTRRPAEFCAGHFGWRFGLDGCGGFLFFQRTHFLATNDGDCIFTCGVVATKGLKNERGIEPKEIRSLWS